MLKTDAEKFIAALWFIIIGLGVIWQGKVNIEGTNKYLTGTGAKLAGLFLIGFGVYLFLS